MSLGSHAPSSPFNVVALASSIAQEVLLHDAPDVDACGQFPIEGINELKRTGLLGLCIPAELGGKAQNMAAFVEVTETLAQVCPSTAMVFVMHITGTQTILATQRARNRTRILTDIAGGNHLTTLAFSEKGSRSHFWAPVSRLEPTGSDYILSADKSWVTSAGHADSYVCSAQSPTATSPAESTLFLLDPKQSGVETAGSFDGIGLRGNDSAPVHIRSARINSSDLLTEHCEGGAVILEVVLPWFALGSAAMANGIALAALHATAKHLENSRFDYAGTFLRDLPVLRARLAQMSVQTEQSRSLLQAALREFLVSSPSAPLRILQSRLSSIETAVNVTDGAMKCAGGAAFSKHTNIERFFRDARAGWVMSPTADHLNDFIGRTLTGLPLFS
jgi:alkylation response protein AidB-like acyl-CoA dehydrogenase